MVVTGAILDRFGATYGPGGALRLTARMNFSVRKARPVPYSTASPEEIDAYVGNTIKAIRRHAGLDYSVICLDTASLADSPSSALGIRPRGGRDTAGVNFSTKTTRIIRGAGCQYPGYAVPRENRRGRRDLPAGVRPAEARQDIRDTGQRWSPIGQRRWPSTSGKWAAGLSCGSCHRALPNTTR